MNPFHLPVNHHGPNQNSHNLEINTPVSETAMDRVPYYWNMLKIFDGMQTMKTLNTMVYCSSCAPWLEVHSPQTFPRISIQYQPAAEYHREKDLIYLDQCSDKQIVILTYFEPSIQCHEPVHRRSRSSSCCFALGASTATPCREYHHHLVSPNMCQFNLGHMVTIYIDHNYRA